MQYGAYIDTNSNSFNGLFFETSYLQIVNKSRCGSMAFRSANNQLSLDVESSEGGDSGEQSKYCIILKNRWIGVGHSKDIEFFYAG